MSSAVFWLAALVALPVVVIALSFLRRDVERLRWLSVASGASMVTVALAMSSQLRGLSIRTEALSRIPGGEAIIRVDTLSAALLPLAAGLWLLTVAVTPRAVLDRRGLRRTALATLITVASFLTESAVVLLALSGASVWTFLSALTDPAQQRQRRLPEPAHRRHGPPGRSVVRCSNRRSFVSTTSAVSSPPTSPVLPRGVK